MAEFQLVFGHIGQVRISRYLYIYIHIHIYVYIYIYICEHKEHWSLWFGVQGLSLIARVWVWGFFGLQWRIWSLGSRVK